MTTTVVPVGLLTSYLRQLIENDLLLADIWVEGEVSSVFTSRSGHTYFTLSDPDTQLKCVLFRSFAQRQRMLPSPGDQIAAHGRMTVYERDGTYQLTADVIEHAGQGLMALQFERLRQQLDSEGLFDVARKRPLPALPRYIGVVTSAEGAVWHDIQTVLKRRYPLAHLILSAAPVQGAAAPDGIVEALDRLQRDGRAEVVILARGGGSAEDLACFNDERVARAVFASRIPIVSAVGHETDWTIIDFVADIRAPTPSAAAELCAPSVESLADDVDQLANALRESLTDTLASEALRLAAIGRHLVAYAPTLRVQDQRLELERLRVALDFVNATMVPALRVSADTAVDALGRCRFKPIEDRNAIVEGLASVLDALDPSRVLSRGYAVIHMNESNRPVTSAHDMMPGNQFVAQLHDGSLHATVVGTEAIQRTNKHARA